MMDFGSTEELVRLLLTRKVAVGLRELLVPTETPELRLCLTRARTESEPPVRVSDPGCTGGACRPVLLVLLSESDAVVRRDRLAGGRDVHAGVSGQPNHDGGSSGAVPCVARAVPESVVRWLGPDTVAVTNATITVHPEDNAAQETERHAEAAAKEAARRSYTTTGNHCPGAAGLPAASHNKKKTGTATTRFACTIPTCGHQETEPLRVASGQCYGSTFRQST